MRSCSSITAAGTAYWPSPSSARSASATLRADEVDIAPVELDREQGAIDTPRLPVVRASTPVVGPDGRSFGIVVIDIDLRGPFARVRENARPGGAVYIVNSNGDYLVHPDPAREFGFQLKLRQRANIMLKVCELAESYRPETDKAMTREDELKVDEIYRLLSRAMDLPAAASWLDD